MRELRCDLEWVEETVREDILGDPELVPMGVGRAVPEGYFERFSGVLPESALYIWRRFGFDGFGEGRSWITDPLEWAPVVGVWLEGVELPFPDRQWYCITRTALGRMTLWGEVSGPALKVDVIRAVISPDSRAAEDAGDPVIRERMGCTRFTSPAGDVQVDDVSGLPLADGAIGRLGVLGAGQVYGFEPPWRGDRAWRSDLLEVREAVPYLVDLARGARRRVGFDFMGAWGGAVERALSGAGAPLLGSTGSTGSPADGPDDAGDPGCGGGPPQPAPTAPGGAPGGLKTPRDVINSIRTPGRNETPTRDRTPDRTTPDKKHHQHR